MTLSRFLFFLRKDLRGFLTGKFRAPSGQAGREFEERVRAEITRRQTNAQIRVLQAQERQIEAQGKQLEAQGKAARNPSPADAVVKDSKLGACGRDYRPGLRHTGARGFGLGISRAQGQRGVRGGGGGRRRAGRRRRVSPRSALSATLALKAGSCLRRVADIFCLLARSRRAF